MKIYPHECAGAKSSYMFNLIVYFFNNIRLKKNRKDTKIAIKYVLLIIINYHIYIC